MVSVEQWRAAPRVRRLWPRCSYHAFWTSFALPSHRCTLARSKSSINYTAHREKCPRGCARALHRAPYHPPCDFCTLWRSLMHHGPTSATRGRYTTVTKLFIVQFCCCSSWRPSTARPNVQHGAGATNGIFNPIRWSACVLCVHGRLSAKEELQNIAETRATRSMPRLLMVPPPLNFRAATERKKKI